MNIRDLISELETTEETYGKDVEVAIDATPPAEANEITGINRIYESDGGVLICALKLGWRIA